MVTSLNETRNPPETKHGIGTTACLDAREAPGEKRIQPLKVAAAMMHRKSSRVKFASVLAFGGTARFSIVYTRDDARRGLGGSGVVVFWHAGTTVGKVGLARVCDIGLTP